MLSKEIGWTITDPSKKVFIIPPEKLNIKECGITGGLKWCPAFHEMHQNIFIIRSPFDCTLIADDEGDFAFDAPFSNPESQGFIGANPRDRNNYEHPVVQIIYDIVWCTDTPDTWIETLPPFLHFHELDWISNVRYILGSFDVHAWPRNVNICFEIMKHNQHIKIKKGMPLLYIKFTNKTKPSTKYKLKDLNDKDNSQLHQVGHVNSLVPTTFKEGYLKWSEIFNRAKNMRKNRKFMKGK